MLGIGPILGAGIGGFVYQHAGTVVLYTGASALALAGAVVAWFALSTPALSEPGVPGTGDRTRHHVTEADEHRAFVERRWPELGVRTFEPVGGGWDCFTYVVNGEWVFQFPRSPGAAERLTTQIAVLPELAREVSSAIPSPEYTSTDPVCMGYARIDGRPMSADVDGIWPERLGRFLYDLHLTPPEFVGLRSTTASAVRDGLRREVDALSAHVLPLLDPGERATAERTLAAFLDDDDNFRFATGLTHGDIGPEHVLITDAGRPGGRDRLG